MVRLVADLGNSRLKIGRLGSNPGIVATVALDLDNPAAWGRALDAWSSDSTATSWAVSTVNPPAAESLSSFLTTRGVQEVRWFQSAADVPVRHTLEHPKTAGADRALAVFAASALQGTGRAGAVVSCGTALTVERIDPEGVWQGGAIAPGLAITARSLHQDTAQLPRIGVVEAPAAWGRSTAPAIAAGVFWGCVGAIRELLARQAEGLEPPPWVIWTGGDAPALAPMVMGTGAIVVPDLVLTGVALAAFGGRAR